MVMHASPVAPFVLPQAELLLQLPVVALNTPAHLGDIDQLFQRGIRRGCRQKVFQRFGITLRPLNQQPLRRAQGAAPAVLMGSTHPEGRKARTQGFVGALTPGNGLVRLRRQTQRQCFDRDGHMARRAAQILAGASESCRRLERQGGGAGCPNAGRRADPHRIGNPHIPQCVAKSRTAAVGWIRQHNTGRNAVLLRLLDLCQGDFNLGGKGNVIRHAGCRTARANFRPVLGCHCIGTLPLPLASDRLTATWQFSVLPSCPQYCRVTPTE